MLNNGVDKVIVGKVFTTEPGLMWLKRQTWFRLFIKGCSVLSANAWSKLRAFGAIPVICSIWFLESHLTALFFFLLFALTDLIDGEVARLKGEADQYGAYLDATVDKFFILPIIMYLYIGWIQAYDISNWWLILMALLVLFDTLGKWIIKRYWTIKGKTVNYKSNWWGKWKFGLQVTMVGFILLAYLINWDYWTIVINGFLIFANIFALGSMIGHLFYSDIK